jgi:hypothetical protein
VDATTASMDLVETIFSGPLMEAAQDDSARYSPKPNGTSDQGYRED